MKTKTINQKSLLDYYGFTKAEQKKYPVVTGILKQLTPERIEKEIKEIQEVKLPPELQQWVKEYEKVGNRDKFIWKWLYSTGQKTTLSTVPKIYKNFVYRFRFLIFMIDILLDDIVDKIQSKNLLNNSLKIPLNEKFIYSNLELKEKKYLNFIIKLWNSVIEMGEKSPRYKEFEEIFRFDIFQLFNALMYSSVIQKHPFLTNKIENWMYPPHHMTVMVCCTVDFMCSPKFNIKDFGIMREIAWESQKMARISNWISTWERELIENDFSSEVVVSAINYDIIDANNLKNKLDKLEIIKKIKNSKVEKKLLKQWEECYVKIYNISSKIKTVNIEKILSDAEIFLIMNLISIQKI